MANNLLQVFFNVDMRCSHEGLKAVAKKRRRCDVEKLNQGDCVIFVNTAMTRLKMFASGSKCLVYVSEGNRRIAPETIKFLPQYLSGGELDYRGALKEAIDKHFAKRQSRSKS